MEHIGLFSALCVIFWSTVFQCSVLRFFILKNGFLLVCLQFFSFFC